MNQLAQQTIRNPVLSDLLQSAQTAPGTGYFSALLTTFATIILIVGALYFFFQLLTGGVEWIGSGGDKAKLEGARQKLINAVIGLVLLFSAWAVVQLVEAVFGVNILNLDVPVVGQ
ncbi:hypothetical protein A2803_01495 [Candidatus Woesebacteria bacterium RIFCSPHIGHO2_01_FULL_44_21]|uniref:Uncharacterized protein n=1 Tax=Candidatus Woesebacteria bacterium RIFCSPHIGHO2_01_FULL_44_21 TaxID=1802503 RepID=A0A1F7YZR4_9BACT|nr:MAG: hypothetical protein A2803_01495 [Candidatus Woesebacteria bacterium RIFCSPHIGHO2_01_FULL_44_21]